MGESSLLHLFVFVHIYEPLALSSFNPTLFPLGLSGNSVTTVQHSRVGCKDIMAQWKKLKVWWSSVQAWTFFFFTVWISGDEVWQFLVTEENEPSDLLPSVDSSRCGIPTRTQLWPCRDASHTLHQLLEHFVSFQCHSDLWCEWTLTTGLWAS